MISKMNREIVSVAMKRLKQEFIEDEIDDYVEAINMFERNDPDIQGSLGGLDEATQEFCEHIGIWLEGIVYRRSE